MAENWGRFEQRFALHLSNQVEGAKRQAAMFLRVVSDDVLEVYNCFTFADGDEMKVEPLFYRSEMDPVDLVSIDAGKYRWLHRLLQYITTYYCRLRELCKRNYIKPRY